jgi:hypothetical protein
MLDSEVGLESRSRISDSESRRRLEWDVGPTSDCGLGVSDVGPKLLDHDALENDPKLPKQEI